MMTVFAVVGILWCILTWIGAMSLAFQDYMEAGFEDSPLEVLLSLLALVFAPLFGMYLVAELVVRELRRYDW